MLRRRSFLLAAASLAATSAAAAAPRPVTVYKTADCTCCEGWVAAMARAGFAPTVVAGDNIVEAWRSRGVPDALSSCHMGIVDEYAIVGHVPPSDVLRLLRESPPAIGLTVPGMPWGSPGMKSPDGRTQPYETLLILKAGGTRVFARHG